MRERSATIPRYVRSDLSKFCWGLGLCSKRERAREMRKKRLSELIEPRKRSSEASRTELLVRRKNKMENDLLRNLIDVRGRVICAFALSYI